MKKLALLILLIGITMANIYAKVRYQKITINTDSQNEIYIDGELAIPEGGKYLLAKNQKTHTIVAKREGYKDEVVCAVPYQSNGYFYPISYEVGLNMTKLPAKLDDAKNLRVNNVAVDLKNEKNKIRIFSDYNKYLKRNERQEAISREKEEDIEYDNTIFSYNLNEFLKSTGFIDTSDNVFKDGYLDNLITDINVTEYTYHRAPAHQYYNYGGMLYVELKATWTLKDIYGIELYTTEAHVKSGYFGYESNDKITEVAQNAITDALTSGLIGFMEDATVRKALKDKSDIEKENSVSTLNLNTGGAFASSLNDVIKSSVTIKADDSHGSGFIISSDGYIVTNYHVIADAEKLTVVTNSQEEHQVKIVRVSKVADLALLKIDASGFLPIQISSSNDIEIAADIYAVGTPKAADLNQTVSKGIISGIRKAGNNLKLIQTDASINSGNSGGAMVNSNGVALGVVSAKLFGFGVEGVGFGIPSYEVLSRLKVVQ